MLTGVDGSSFNQELHVFNAAIEIQRMVTIKNLLLKINGRTFPLEELEGIQVAHVGSVSPGNQIMGS